MTLIPIKTPLLAKKMFPNYLWDIPSDKKVIYLTFDDGPTPEITDWVINTLKDYNAQATFFCIGDNVKKYPAIFKNVINNGHSIGNHTQKHLKGWKHKTDIYLKDVEDAENTITKILNSEFENLNLFRPPYGKLKPKQGRIITELGYKIVMWDVLSFDWDKDVSQEKCFQNVISKASNGSIVVFHDSKKAAKNMQYALPKVLEYFSEKGYVFDAIKLKRTAE